MSTASAASAASAAGAVSTAHPTGADPASVTGITPAAGVTGATGAASTTGVAGTSGTTATPSAADPARQVLVLLHLPAVHYRPDSVYAGSYGGGPDAAARRRVAAELARGHGLALVTDWPLPLLGVDCYVMAVPPGRTPQAAAEALARDARVEWAQPMHVYRTHAAQAPRMSQTAQAAQTAQTAQTAQAAPAAPSHDDPLFRAQPAAESWHLAQLHALATGRGVRIAVIDSGVDAAHPDLAGQVAESADFVADAGAARTRDAQAAERHGTAVAGIVAARADDGIGIAGVAPGARLLALRACREEETTSSAAASAAPTFCTSLALARALHHAVERGAVVINLSLGGPPDRLLGRLLDVALGRGIVVVAAVDEAEAQVHGQARASTGSGAGIGTDSGIDIPNGNSTSTGTGIRNGNSNGTGIRNGNGNGSFPASHPGVVAVAATSSAVMPAGTLAAPGRDVPVPVPGGRWALVSGSSYAAAHVSGLFALLRELGTPARGESPAAMAVLVLRAGGAIDTCATLRRIAGPRACAASSAALAGAEPGLKPP